MLPGFGPDKTTVGIPGEHAVRETNTYDAVSRVNHWIVAAAMIGMLGLGLYLEYGGLERDAKSPLLNLHKATGVLVLLYGVWRVGWRLVRGFPTPASAMPAWQESAAKTAHWILLMGILAMPVSGLLRSLYRGRAVDVFGVFTIPAPEKIEWISTVGAAVHTYLGYVLVAVVLAHVGAALKHHLIDRDSTLVRMLSGSTARRSDVG